MPQKIALRWDKGSVGDDRWPDEAVDCLHIGRVTSKMMLCRECREVGTVG